MAKNSIFFQKVSIRAKKVDLALFLNILNSCPSINHLPQISAYLLGIPIVWRIDSAKLISDDSSSDAEDIAVKINQGTKFETL